MFHLVNLFEEAPLVGTRPSEESGLPAWYHGKSTDLASEMTGLGSAVT